MILTDEEKLDLRTQMLVGGYKESDTTYFESPSYKKLRTTMADHLAKGNLGRFKYEFLPKSEILKAGRYVIDRHFDRFDLRVPYTNGDDVKTQLYAIFGENPEPQQYDDIIDYIDTHVELVRVTDIPLYINTNGERNGYEAETWFYGNKIMEESYYKKLNHSSKEIAVEGNCDEQARCIYVHEMSHALINRHKKNTRNILNREAFPIFMERVAASDIEPDREFLDLNIFGRILQTKRHVLQRELNCFNENNYFNTLYEQTYILSTLHATALFDTYDKGSKKQKSEIDNALGEVITGKAVLEDVFDYYDATLDRGSKIMQRQIKKYDQKYQK